MKNTLKVALAVTGLALAAHASAQITLYEDDNFRGRAFTPDRDIRNLDRHGFNDMASSIVIQGGRWEVCTDAEFRGKCLTLRPGQYPSLRPMGMNDSISSVRMVGGPPPPQAQYAPPPGPPPGEYYQRPQERLYAANVVAVHAVVGPPQQRCWVEQQQVTENRPNAGGAIAGALIGGILGHQVGRGHGNDAATVGGAVAGAAVGANVGGNEVTRTQDVQRCSNVPSSARPEFWDVIYTFGGYEHHVQMSSPPGPTIWVNGNGDPRQ